jgi:NAD dependent epimerase/dehydratase
VVSLEWKNKAVLVTGAGGFIGSHLVEKLVGLGATVSCLVQYNSMNTWEWIDTFSEGVKGKLDIIMGDLRDGDCVRKAIAGKQIVFHLGALIPIPYSYVNPRDVIQTNVLGTLNVLEGCKEAKVEKLIHTSTSETYGTAQEVPIQETHSLQAQSPYAASKISADKIAESFYLSYGLPVVTVRPFNTFGPRQSARAIIPTVITQVLAEKDVKLGNLDPTRDFTFVGDMVEGFLKSAEVDKAVGETVNLGSHSEISIGDLARKIISVMGKDVNVVEDKQRVRPKGSEVERLFADCTKAKKLLGWEATTSFEDGLKQTISWLKENIRLYKTGIYNI